MFNAEKLLGGMLGNVMGKSSAMESLGLGSKAAIGMGVLGVAFAAAEHFMEKSKTSQQPPQSLPSRPPLSVPQAPPPPPPLGSRAGAPAAPPPPPPVQASPVMAVPPAPVDAPEDAAQQTAIVLIRSMIAAANADGVLDEDEKTRIFDQFANLGLSDEERAFLERELTAPLNVEDLAGSVTDVETARQVYAASFLAIEVDTEEEREYLIQLQTLLNLDDAAVAAIRSELGLA